MSAHDHAHGRHHHGDPGDSRVLWAVGVNLLLTVGQVIGGVAAGSLSLIADALHNFSDAISLGIAYGARRVARRPSDERMTFGYVRAEIIAALINYTTLIVIGLYLVYEGVMRILDPQPITGWLVVIVAIGALVVDLVTAALTYALSKESMNIRAAFLHNVADALGSVGVIVAGTLVIFYDWRIVDPIVTLMIAGYILWMAFSEIGGSIRMLMLGAPPDLDVRDVLTALREVEGVADVHHLHIWSIDEQNVALEAHLVVDDGDETGRSGADVRQRVRKRLRERFNVSHTTLEIEPRSECCDGADAQVVGHVVAGHAERGRV